MIASTLDILSKRELHFSIQDIRNTDNSGKYEFNIYNLILYGYLFVNFMLLFVGLYYVSFSHFRVPIARLEAAQAALAYKNKKKK